MRKPAPAATPLVRGHLTLIRGNGPRWTPSRPAPAPAPPFDALPDVRQARHPLAAGFYLDRNAPAPVGSVRVIGVAPDGRRAFEATLDGALCYRMEAAGIFEAARPVLDALPAARVEL